MQSPYVSLQQTGVNKNENSLIAAALPKTDKWWHRLNDPAIDLLVTEALANNPTLDNAVARILEARAQVSISKADYWPLLLGAGSLTKADTTIKSSATGPGSKITSGIGGGVNNIGLLPGRSTIFSLGPSLSWEIDLFGRIRGSVEVAQHSLNARNADAENTRLALAAQIASTVLDLRACYYSIQMLDEQIISQQKTLDLTRKKVVAGLSSIVDEANVLTALSLVQHQYVAQNEQCEVKVNAVVALTGSSRNVVISVIAKNASNDFMPEPPEVITEIPASILMSHPKVISADHDAAAAWSDIGVARAQRLPKFDLGSALTGEWIRALGLTFKVLTSSLAPSVAATLFDGGKLAANVDAAEARYIKSLANLEQVLRTTVQEFQDVLAMQKSAVDSYLFAKQAASAATQIFKATAAKYNSGEVSILELEDSRRQLATANTNLMNAARDRAQAWVNFINATGLVNRIS